MHICLKCKRAFNDIKEIENGCVCGSKIFIYKKDPSANDLKSIEKSAILLYPSDSNNSFYKSNKDNLDKDFSFSNPKNSKNKKLVVNNYSLYLSKNAQISIFRGKNIENIRMISKGIFELNLLGLLNKSPVVIKDYKGIYYVRLPVLNSNLNSNNLKHQKE
jgi:predicted  nucleic acid-binding Zn-ribbon protein